MTSTRGQIVRILCLALAAIWLAVGNVVAQDTTVEFNASDFDAAALRAEDVISRGQASSEALTDLRSQLSNLRSLALVAQEQRGQRAKTVREQITALGPIPEEGQSEALEVAERRAELEAQLAEAQAPVIVAQEAYQRADGLIGEIDSILRERRSRQLFMVTSSPLNPTLWPQAWRDLTGYFTRLRAETFEIVQNGNEAAIRRANAPGIVALSLLGLFLLFPVTLRLARSIRAKDTSAKVRRAVVRGIKILAYLGIPLLGAFLLIRALDLADINGLRGAHIVATLPSMAFSVLAGNWLARTFFEAGGAGERFLQLDSETIQSGRFITRSLGVVYATKLLLDAFAKGGDWSDDTQAVLSLPLILVASYGLFRLAQKASRRSVLSNSDVGDGAARQFVWLATIAAFGVAVLAPLIAALGYGFAGTALVYSTLLTLALAATLLVLFDLGVGVLDRLASREENQSDEDITRQSGLLHVALGFLLLCAGLPLLALVWGATRTEILELWFYLRDGISLGDTRLSASDILTFILVFVIGYMLTRLLQSALRGSVLPNTRLDIGAQNALVTGIGYVGIVLAALVAIMATGLDLSNLAIVAGALSVGIGFGLQAIVSNFVSGIILLIERPIKKGDWVEVGSYSGYVQDISVRSTTIETFDRATVVVPNADLITGTVTNWTHDSLRGRVKVPVGVAYGSDVARVKDILLEIASEHPMVLSHPKPLVYFLGFGADSLDFEIRAILRDINWVMSVRSDMNFAISKRFAEEGIDIPFAQREVTLKNADELAKAIKSGKE